MATDINEFIEPLMEFGHFLSEELVSSSIKDQHLITQGHMLFKESSIHVQNIDEQEVLATVYEGGAFDVRLNLDFPLFSSCSCHEDSWCAHQLAVFFTVYNELGDVNDWMQQWSTRSTQPIDIFNIPGVRRASDLLAQSKLKEPAGKEGPEGWIERLHLTISSQMNMKTIQKNPYMLEYQGQAVYQQLIKQSPLEREWRPLFRLFMSSGLFMVLVDELRHAEHSPEILQRACSSFLYFLVDEATESAHELSVHAQPFEFDLYIGYLRTDIQRLIDPEKTGFFVEKLDLYRVLWNDVFKKESWRRQELRRLEEFLPSQSVFIHIPILHQLFLLNEMSRFTEQFAQCNESVVDFCLFWMQELFEYKQNEKTVVLLSAMAKKLGAYMASFSNEYESRNFVKWFFHYMDEEWLSDHHPDLLKNLLLQMLPYSFYQFSKHLYMEGKYREWAELQLWIGMDLPELEAVGLKEVTKQAPDAVLPLYHHGIHQLINSRSRPHYKQAVRYLKKLRTLYKKQKKMQRWDLYFSNLITETKRLRAFQEECRKGKLLDD
ncbi:MAG TPA: hypothetical protein VEY51_07785 [Chondromyces sp.]|nr:hypothetical protein [Chondromyces sp.]